MRGRHAILVEPCRDRGQCFAAQAVPPDAAQGRIRERRWPTELHTLASLHRQGLAGALPDEPPLELGKDRQNVGHHLAGRRGRVDAQVQGHQGPACAPPAFHQRGKVEQRAREAIKLGNHERCGYTAVKRGQSGLQAGAPSEGPPRGRILVDIGKAPAPALALVTNGASLRLESRPGVELLIGRHPDVAHDGQRHTQHNYHKRFHSCTPNVDEGDR